MKRESLYDKLIKYGKNGRYPFHMPGHKRQTNLLPGSDPFSIDITEITGFDSLHHAEGLIKDTMECAAQFYGTDWTWFLVNGSSGGILSAIHSVTNIGDNIIIGRNCHKSVYNAVQLRNLKTKYIYPEYIRQYGIYGGYNLDELKNLLEKCKQSKEQIKAVVVTSPTYDGIVSDIQKIARITHEYNAVLIVDEAHGAHFGIHDRLPIPAYRLGADLVIESVHKTLPSLTQTAVLHLCGQRADKIKVEQCLSIYQSSSPSYLFLASIDQCIRRLQSEGRKKTEQLLAFVNDFRKKVNQGKHFCVPGKEIIGQKEIFDVDETKLIIVVDSDYLTGKELADILRNQYNFEMEMETAKYVLAITTICDDFKEIDRLADCLLFLDKQLDRKEAKKIPKNSLDGPFPKNNSYCSIYQAGNKETESVRLEKAQGKISAEYVYLYPPEIPLIVPGEIISREIIHQLMRYKQMELNIKGLRDKENKYIQVIKDC